MSITCFPDSKLKSIDLNEAWSTSKTIMSALFIALSKPINSMLSLSKPFGIQSILGSTKKIEPKPIDPIFWAILKAGLSRRSSISGLKAKT